MKKRTKALLFQLPGAVILILSFIISFYIKLLTDVPLTWETPILLGIVLAMYFYGRKLEKDAIFEKYG
ncbi:MAG: hypothetical protein ACOCUU_02885 [Nanoarchaeota archaeon]